MSGSNEDTVTISRADYDVAARSQALLNQLLTNPKHAPKIEDAIAEVNPNAKFPQREAREAVIAPVNAALAEERAKREALEKRLNEREERETAERTKHDEDALLAKISGIKSKRGFSDEMMDKVIARMREQNNPDVEAAAAWVSESLPKPPPVSGHDFLPSTVDAFGSASQDKAWEGLHKDPGQWQQQEIRSIINDPEFLRLGNA